VGPRAIGPDRHDSRSTPARARLRRRNHAKPFRGEGRSEAPLPTPFAGDGAPLGGGRGSPRNGIATNRRAHPHEDEPGPLVRLSAPLSGRGPLRNSNPPGTASKSSRSVREPKTVIPGRSEAEGKGIHRSFHGSRGPWIPFPHLRLAGDDGGVAGDETGPVEARSNSAEVPQGENGGAWRRLRPDRVAPWFRAIALSPPQMTVRTDRNAPRAGSALRRPSPAGDIPERPSVTVAVSQAGDRATPPLEAGAARA